MFGLMLFGIRSQLPIVIINLASSTALRSMCIYAYKGAYSHTRKSDSKSDMSIWAMPQPRQPGIVVMKEVFCVFYYWSEYDGYH